jgi:hypothetical protein
LKCVRRYRQRAIFEHATHKRPNPGMRAAPLPTCKRHLPETRDQFVPRRKQPNRLPQSERRSRSAVDQTTTSNLQEHYAILLRKDPTIDSTHVRDRRRRCRNRIPALHSAPIWSLHCICDWISKHHQKMFVSSRPRRIAPLGPPRNIGLRECEPSKSTRKPGSRFSKISGGGRVS